MYACSAYLSPLFSSQNITVIVAGEKATEAEGEGEGARGIVRLRRPSLPPQFRVSARNVNIPLFVSCLQCLRALVPKKELIWVEEMF